MEKVICPKCGSENVVKTSENNYDCPNCGQQFKVEVQAATTSPNSIDDKLNVGWIFATIIIPLIGLILYFVKKDETPESAKNYLWISIGAWILYLIGILE